MSGIDLKNGKNGSAPVIQLNSGHNLPVVGLGTYALHGSTCTNAVIAAIQSGYGHNSCCVLIVLKVLELSLKEGVIGIVLLMTKKERSMSNAGSNCKDKRWTDPVLSRK